LVNKINVNEIKHQSRLKRLGLDTGMTGIPAFLIYLREDINLKNIFSLSSHDEVRILQEKAKCEEDRKTISYLIPFFESGGTRAIVITSKLKGSNEDEYLADLIGSNSGYDFKSGIYNLSKASDLADLVVVPQASVLLTGENHETFYQQLTSYIEEIGNYFVLIDTPIRYKVSECVEWSKKVRSSEAAVFYPWVISNNIVAPPAAAIAGIIQNNDKQNFISDSPANRSVNLNWLPVVVSTPAELNYLTENKVNALHYFGQGDIRIWGAYTLTPDNDNNKRNISTRRALKAIEKSLNNICEAYVLEPLKWDISNEVEMAIEEFFNKVPQIFDPTVRAPFQVRAYISKDKASSDILEINIRFKLPNTLDEMNLALDYKG